MDLVGSKWAFDSDCVIYGADLRTAAGDVAAAE